MAGVFYGTPDLVIDTSRALVEYSLDCLVDYVKRMVPFAQTGSAVVGSLLASG